jgi:hypothetical protein
MITMTPEAIEYVRQRGGSLFLEYIILQSGCCIPFQPGPAVRIGRPRRQIDYREMRIEDLTVFLPPGLPDVSLVIKVNSFLGLSRLVVEGWQHA